jgi:hypothetical protein
VLFTVLANSNSSYSSVTYKECPIRSAKYELKKLTATIYAFAHVFNVANSYLAYRRPWLWKGDSPASQVDEVDLGGGLAGHVVVPQIAGLHERDREDGVRARRHVVHLRRRRRAVQVSAMHALLPTNRDDVDI